MNNYTEGTITRRMDSAFNGLQNEFKSLCMLRKKDFEVKLEALKKAWNKSDRHSKLKKLYDMFDEYGIEYEYGMDYDYYENLVNNSNISEFDDIEDRMLYALYTRYKEYPSPEDYMKRMVDRLCNKEDGWEKDTLRVRILKQFIKYGNYLTDAGVKGKKIAVEYAEEKAGKKLDGEDIVSFIDDGVFSALGVEKKELSLEGLSREEIKKLREKEKNRLKEVRRNSELLKMADDLAGGKFRVEGATKKSLYMFAMVYDMTYSTGRDFENLNFERDIETNLFRDYYSNNLIRFVSEVYKNGGMSKYELDPSGQGINYKNFAEMVYLYYIVKDCSPQEKIKLSGKMIKRIQDKQFKQGEVDTRVKGGTEVYRNYLKRTDADDLFSEDILSKPEEEFENFICENYNCETYDGSYDKGKKTIDLKKGVLLLETEQESAFREYQSVLDELTRRILAKNYNYDFSRDDDSYYKQNRKQLYDRVSEKLPEEIKESFTKVNLHEFVVKNIFKQGDKENSSFEEYKEDINKAITEIALENCSYGLWFTDIAFFKEKRSKNKKSDVYERIYNILPEKEKNDFTRESLDKFVTLLFAFNSFLGYTADESPSSRGETRKRSSAAKTGALFVSSKSAVTRTSLIVAYYYLYNTIHEDDIDDMAKNFEEVFNNFKKDIKPRLENAFYQPLSGRNLFDVLVVFSAYAYLYL